MRRSRRRAAAPAAKYDIPYTTELASPHLKWADPYVRGPIDAFFLSTVAEGRTVVELMQRLSLNVRAVSVDPCWDVNRWCMDRYEDFDGRDPKDYSKSWEALEPELASNRRYDVLVMHSVLGWNHMPEAIREQVSARVERGDGLVLVHPHLGEEQSDTGLWSISPLVSVPPTRLTKAGAGMDEGYPEPPKQALSGKAWEKAAEHYIVDGLPFDALPYAPLKHYRYELGEEAEALATGEGGAPVIAVKEHGKGRVVGLGYHNYGLFPELDMRRGERPEIFWEYLFSILIRSIVWAARKEPPVRLQEVRPSGARFAPEQAERGELALRLSNSGSAAQARVEITFRDERGEVTGTAERRARLRKGERTISVELPEGPAAGGRHTADVMVTAGGKKQDWGSATYEVARGARVTKVSLESDAVAVGKAIRGRARLTGSPAGMTLVSELWDLSGRLLSRQERRVSRKGELTFRLRCPDALTNRGWVVCTLQERDRYVDSARAEVALTAPRRSWRDYEVIMPWLHGGVWPWTDLVERQYRSAGITSTSDTQWEFPLTGSMHPPGFGVYWYRRHPYLERKDRYRKTGDRKWLARVPCIHTSDFRRPVARALRRGIPPLLKYSPLAYYIADESSLTCYEDAFDLCWSDATLAAFRKWLRRQYRTLDRLNEEWGTRYRSWQGVVPATWEEAQRRGNPAPWVDHRLFMNRALGDAFRYAAEVAQKVDPDGLVTISGTQLPGSHNGCDWSQIDKIVDYLQPYSGGGQDEMHRSFNPDLILTGFTGYAMSGIPLEYEIWHRFLHGHQGASIFWGYSMLDPDLRLNAQGRSLAKCFGELRGEGLSRAISKLRRAHDKIAVHFSMASGHVWWIQDGELTHEGLEFGRRTSASFNRFIQSRSEWGHVFEDLGYQYDYLAYDRVEEGVLGKGEYRALVLPGSIALSEEEVEQIKQFVRRGGLVVADAMPGQTDLHGRRLEEPSLQELFAEPKYGRGRAVLLDRWLEDYEDIRLEADGAELRSAIQDALEQVGVRPRVEVIGRGGYPVGVERVTWRGRGIEACALLKEPSGRFTHSADLTSRYEPRPGMSHSSRVLVKLPEEGHWYDLRAHHYLGRIREIHTTLREAEPHLYAMLPYQVRGVSVLVRGGGRPGDLVEYEAAVGTGGARPVPHVVKVQVLGPDGEERHLYSGNVDTRGGVARGSFRLALNDPMGRWQIVVTDVFSGESARAAWRVG